VTRSFFQFAPLLDLGGHDGESSLSTGRDTCFVNISDGVPLAWVPGQAEEAKANPLVNATDQSKCTLQGQAPCLACERGVGGTFLTTFYQGRSSWLPGVEIGSVN
jgi:hypothetical protein